MSAPPPPARRTWVGPYTVLLFLAVICFILSFVHVGFGTYDPLPLGLAFGFAAFLPWP